MISNCYHTSSPSSIIIAISIVSLGVILIGIGAYFFKANVTTIAYSLLGGGSAFVLGGFIYSLIQLVIKKRAENQIRNPSSLPQTHSNVILPNSKPAQKSKRETLPLLKEYLYPEKRALQSYLWATSEQEAKNLLIQKGTCYGDYTFCKLKDDYFKFFYLGVDGKTIIEKDLNDPTIWHGEIYASDYEHLLFPILPSDYAHSPDVIHTVVVGLKYRAMLIYLDEEHSSTCSFPVGAIHRLIQWLKEYPPSLPKLAFNPYYLFKIAGHVFSFSGNYSYNYKPYSRVQEVSCKIDFEGFDPGLGRTVIAQDIMDYLPQSKLEEPLRNKIEQTAKFIYVVGEDEKNNPSLDDLMNLLDQEIPVSIMTGWKGHSVQLTLTKDRLVYTNKGAGCKGQAGQHVYKINKKPDKAFLSLLLKKQSQDFFPSFNPQSPSQLEQMLELENSFTHPLQKVGNCVFANNRLLFKAAMLLLGVDCKLAKVEFDQFVNTSKVAWINAIYTIIDKIVLNDSLREELCFFLFLILTKYFCKKQFQKIFEHPVMRALYEVTNKLIKINKCNHPYLPMIFNIFFKKGKIDFSQITNKIHRQLLVAIIIKYINFKKLQSRKDILIFIDKITIDFPWDQESFALAT